MTRDILERVVRISMEHPNFDNALINLLDEFELGTYNQNKEQNEKVNKKEEKKGGVFITILSVFFAIILMGLLGVVITYSFFDVPFINSFVDNIQNIASNLTQ